MCQQIRTTNHPRRAEQANPRLTGKRHAPAMSSVICLTFVSPFVVIEEPILKDFSVCLRMSSSFRISISLSFAVLKSVLAVAMVLVFSMAAPVTVRAVSTEARMLAIPPASMSLPPAYAHSACSE